MYVRECDLTGDISPTFLQQALDDTGDGSQVPITFETLEASVEVDIDAYIGLRYALPLGTPYPPVILSAAKILALEKLYKRRGIADDKNPWASQAGQMRTLLKAISLGQSPLSPELNRQDPTASIITQPMRSTPRGRDAIIV